MDSGFNAGAPDFDAVSLGDAGIDYEGSTDVSISSFSFDGGDVDTTEADVYGESADINSADYGETSHADRDGDGDNPDVTINLPETLNRPRVSAVHVVGHSYVDVRAAFERFAHDLGLVRIPWIRVGGRDLSQEYDKLIPKPTGRADQKPDGWYRGATGTTEMTRRYYCIGVREFPLVGKLIYDRSTKVFVEVTCYTWRYRETGDCESLVVMKVISLPSYCPQAHCYIFQTNPLIALNGRIEEVKKSLFRLLKLANPGERCAERRRKALEGNLPSVTDSVVRTTSDAAERPYGQGAVFFPA
jgi:hypothetical protein